MLVPIEWLKEYIDFDLTPNELAEKITMGGVEVEEVIDSKNDHLLSLAPTPNRGDCLGMIGVAREVAALTGTFFKPKEAKIIKGKGSIGKWVKIDVKDSKVCPRYTSRVIEGIKIGQSPDWMRKRLESAGVRSINNVVDATNYVLLEYGQPVHAFDLRFLKDNKLVIDRPSGDIKVELLDGREYLLTTNDILNMDGQRAIGVAGIMGAQNSGVVDDTSTLVLESGFFDPVSVKHTSNRIGVVTESSKRFEKGVDPEGVINALHRLTEIIVETAGGIPSEDWIDIYPNKIEMAEITLDLNYVDRLLGYKIDCNESRKLLSLLGCRVDKDGDNKLNVIVPGYRPDLTRPVDLIEEIARLYGYNNIPDSLPKIIQNSLVKPASYEVIDVVKSNLVDNGFYEAKSYSFSSESELKKYSNQSTFVKIKNPLVSDVDALRTTLVPELLKVVKYNMSRQMEYLKLFEINRAFFPVDDEEPLEKLMLAGAVTGEYFPHDWSGRVKGSDVLQLKGVIWSIFERLGIGDLPEVTASNLPQFMHPGETFNILLDERVLGYCGRLHPDIHKEWDFIFPLYLFEIEIDPIISKYLSKTVRYSQISKYPVVMRDVALLVKSEVTHGKIIQSFKKNLNNLVQSVELFDIYLGKGIPEGKKSMAYRIRFGTVERTLSDEEVDKIFAAMIENVKSETGARIR